jgi:transketolase
MAAPDSTTDGAPVDLHHLARRVRATLVELSHRAQAPHLGSSLSCVDIFVAAYWRALKIDPAQPNAPDRDRFVLSKGHAAPTLFAVLAHRGFFSLDRLREFAAPGSPFAYHPIPRSLPGIEAATGSLGHGLSLGVGMALAGRIQHLPYRVYVLMGDGECNEGSVWEAAMFAPSQQLDNLVAIVDFNRWQATGRTAEVTALEPQADKWAAFGWSVKTVDGHDLETLSRVLSDVPDGSGKPVAIVARTVKGKGVSFMEDDNNWHYRSPSAEECRRAKQELGEE